MALSNLALAQPKQDKLRSLGIMALNGMFDEMDGVAVLRQATTEVLTDDIAIVSFKTKQHTILLSIAPLGYSYYCCGLLSC